MSVMMGMPPEIVERKLKTTNDFEKGIGAFFCAGFP